MQALNIEALSAKQKPIALEEIWDSLKKDNAKELVPDWHLEVLKQREFCGLRRVQKSPTRYVKAMKIKILSDAQNDIAKAMMLYEE